MNKLNYEKTPLYWHILSISNNHLKKVNKNVCQSWKSVIAMVRMRSVISMKEFEQTVLDEFNFVNMRKTTRNLK